MEEKQRQENKRKVFMRRRNLGVGSKRVPPIGVLPFVCRFTLGLPRLSTVGEARGKNVLAIERQRRSREMAASKRKRSKRSEDIPGR